jgi:type III secretion protein L
MATFYRLQAFGHGLAAPAGVVKAATLEELGQAGDILAEGERQAAALIAEAQAVYESEELRGHAEGRAAADAERALRMIEDLGRLDARLADLESELGGVVFACVRQIIAGFEDEALAEQVARSALGSMRSEQRGQLYVSTAALKHTQAALPKLLEGFPEIELVDVIEDPELQAPDVRLESAMGVVTFVLDDTLSALQRLLEQK